MTLEAAFTTASCCHIVASGDVGSAGGCVRGRHKTMSYGIRTRTAPKASNASSPSGPNSNSPSSSILTTYSNTVSSPLVPHTSSTTCLTSAGEGMVTLPRPAGNRRGGLRLSLMHPWPSKRVQPPGDMTAEGSSETWLHGSGDLEV